MIVDPPLTFHIVPRAVWEATDPTQAYQPASLASEGFIHCTDDGTELAAAGNRYYRAVPGPFAVLVIQRALVQAPVRYDDPDRCFSHIYGPLNRDAIRAVREMPRAADGTFLPFAYREDLA